MRDSSECVRSETEDAMKLPLVFMCSGQGSHYYQMGRELYESNVTFRECMQHLDSLSVQLSGESIITELYNDSRARSDTFLEILHTHPAIYMVQCALDAALREKGVIASYILGASLGSYVAAACAGCLTVDDGLRLVLGQAKIIKQYGRAGAMIAVLASPTVYDDFPELNELCDIAALNFDTHFVVSAPGHSVRAVLDFLRRRAIDFHEIAVGYPFHSRWLNRAAPLLRAQLGQVHFSSPCKPLVCCATATVLTHIDADFLWDAGNKPIRFAQTIRALENAGRFRYIDLGPSGTLATFAKYALPDRARGRIHSLMSPFGCSSTQLDRLILKASTWT